MHLALLALALQLRTVALAAPPPSAVRAGTPPDSARDLRRARSEQASFERARRSYLPWETGGLDRCDVRVGRFCWWYDDYEPTLPPESAEVAKRRARLIALLDTLARRHPGDDWLAGMAVYYRVEAHETAAADSAARACGGTAWWCHALAGYAAHSGGDAERADSAFGAALREMPDDVRCAWSDIHTLLPGDLRGRYEDLPCSAREAVERRYWMLGRPRLADPVNDWHTEFLARRVQGWLAERSLTPQGLGWGDDAAELLLRYGWPVRWSRVQRSSVTLAPDVGIIGHDPWPSFAFGPREEVLDSLAAAGDDGWELQSRQSESRYAPRGVRRVAPVDAQIVRFRRGDSTLVAAAFHLTDDSVQAPMAQLAAALDDGRTFASAPDSVRAGIATLLLPALPRLAGVEIADSAAGTLARARVLYPPSSASPALSLSDILLYRAAEEPAATLDSALAIAIAGDTVARRRPLGVFWETYRTPGSADSVDVAITMERIDRGWFRSARQRLGITGEDSPLRMRWTDTRPAADAVTPYAISLDLGNLAEGRYRLTLSVTPAGGAPVSSIRELELIDR
jgi:hypothetical protein